MLAPHWALEVESWGVRRLLLTSATSHPLRHLSFVTYVDSSFRLLTSYFLRKRIAKAANAIYLKDYSSFLRSKQAPA